MTAFQYWEHMNEWAAGQENYVEVIVKEDYYCNCIFIIAYIYEIFLCSSFPRIYYEFYHSKVKLADV